LDCVIARSGHDFTHAASTQPRQVRAKLKTGAMRTTRIRERIGFQFPSPFSTVQAYSQIPHPMHLLGSTDMNFLGIVLQDISVTYPFSELANIVQQLLLTVTYGKRFFHEIKPPKSIQIIGDANSCSVIYSPLI
jgi:hypothetical protein